MSFLRGKDQRTLSLMESLRSDTSEPRSISSDGSEGDASNA